MNIEDFREVVKKLEPDAWAGGEGIEPFIISLAVSAKRIADALDDIVRANAVIAVDVRES